MRKFLLALILVLCISNPAFAGRTTLESGAGTEISTTGTALDVNIASGGATGETVGAVAAGTVGVGGGIAESTVPTEQPDADVIAIWFDTFGRQFIAGYNAAVGALDVNPISQEPIGSGSIICADVTLDDSPTSATCTVFVGDKRNITIILNAVMDWTDSNPDLDLDLKVEASGDNTTFYDVDVLIGTAGTDAPETSPISLPLSSGDTDTTHERFWYFADGFTTQYLKLTMTATNSDSDDTIVLDVIVMYQK